MTLAVQAALPGTQPPESGRPIIRCLRCHRVLTTADARLYRLGSRCRHTTPATPPRGHVDQDQLPGLDPGEPTHQ